MVELSFKTKLGLNSYENNVIKVCKINQLIFPRPALEDWIISASISFIHDSHTLYPIASDACSDLFCYNFYDILKIAWSQNIMSPRLKNYTTVSVYVVLSYHTNWGAVSFALILLPLWWLTGIHKAKYQTVLHAWMSIGYV